MLAALARYAEALAACEKAIELNPFVPEFSYNLALSYELWGRCAEAHAKWFSYLQVEVNKDKQALVRERLQRNFETEGGRCYGWQ